MNAPVYTENICFLKIRFKLKKICLIKIHWHISDSSVKSPVLVKSSSRITVAIYLGALLPPVLKTEVFITEESLNNNSGSRNKILACGEALFKH